MLGNLQCTEQQIIYFPTACIGILYTLFVIPIKLGKVSVINSIYNLRN